MQDPTNLSLTQTIVALVVFPALLAAGTMAAWRLWHDFQRRPWIWRSRLRRFPKAKAVWTWTDLCLLVAYIAIALSIGNLSFVCRHRAPTTASHWEFLMSPLVLHHADQKGLDG